MEEAQAQARRRKSGKWGYIWPMWVTLLLHLIAILLFTRGFLLTRTELPYYSHCSDVSHSPCFSNNGSCWTKPSINRLVIIVLDALRYLHIYLYCTLYTRAPQLLRLTMFCSVMCLSGLISLLPVPSLQVTYLSY